MPKSRPNPERSTPCAKAASRFGVTPRTVRSWATEGAPHSRRGRAYLFDVAELAVWLDRNELGRGHGNYRSGAGGVGELSQQLLAAKVQQVLLDVQKRELQLAQVRGELLRREDVERGQLDRIAYAKAILVGGPASLAPLTSPNAQTSPRPRACSMSGCIAR